MGKFYCATKKAHLYKFNINLKFFKNFMHSKSRISLYKCVFSKLYSGAEVTQNCSIMMRRVIYYGNDDDSGHNDGIPCDDSSANRTMIFVGEYCLFVAQVVASFVPEWNKTQINNIHSKVVLLSLSTLSSKKKKKKNTNHSKNSDSICSRLRNYYWPAANVLFSKRAF